MYSFESKINRSEKKFSELKNTLNKYGIDFSTWGTGTTKTLEHLQKEIDSGETVLVENKDGDLVRQITIGTVYIFYKKPDNTWWKLKEEKQVFSDGRERVRGGEKSISEKMKSDEDPDAMIIRGIQEELQISGDITIQKNAYTSRNEASPSYPGLITEYNEHNYLFVMNDAQFNPDGYQEHQEDKTTFFIWEPAENPLK